MEDHPELAEISVKEILENIISKQNFAYFKRYASLLECRGSGSVLTILSRLIIVLLCNILCEWKQSWQLVS
jgi:hypothetical protein